MNSHQISGYSGQIMPMPQMRRYREMVSMPEWKSGATEFTVSVNYHGVRGYQASIPKPIVDHLGIHLRKERKPRPISFVIIGSKVEIRTSTDT